MSISLKSAAELLVHYIRLTHHDEGELNDVVEAFAAVDEELRQLRAPTPQQRPEQ